MKPLVMVFLKAPRPGTVKTRLGREIGFGAATQLYREMAEEQLRRILPGLIPEIHYAPRGAGAEMRRWLGRGFAYRAQSGGGLGERLSGAFAGAFQRGYRPVIAIGADCPGLEEASLRRAIDMLAGADVVLGPASDGGYYLIGLRHPAPRLFEEIEWSTRTVLAATRARIRECGLSCRTLEEKDDLDDLTALRRFLKRGTVRSNLHVAALIGA